MANETAPAPASPGKGRRAAAAIFMVGALAAGGAGWWMLGGKPEEKAVEIVPEEKETQQTDSGGGTIDINVIQTPRKAPELDLDTGPGSIHLGRQPYGGERLVRTVRVRHVGGRADPITMSGFIVEVLEDRKSVV